MYGPISTDVFFFENNDAENPVLKPI